MVASSCLETKYCSKVILEHLRIGEAGLNNHFITLLPNISSYTQMIEIQIVAISSHLKTTKIIPQDCILLSTGGSKISFNNTTFLRSCNSLRMISLNHQVVERHLTLNKTWKGSDHACSLEPHDLRELVNAIRCVEAALGSPLKAFQPSEDACHRKVRP